MSESIFFSLFFLVFFATSIELSINVEIVHLCRSLWGKESALIAEIDKLRAEVEKAEKSLDHATPGVSFCFLEMASDSMNSIIQKLWILIIVFCLLS